ncbi:Feruloyl esterase [Pleurostoma richardsiae]|uniref:Feruloyl esterase n=1 Tax=Pleurostoma richardsiae TaxID=41990 RepID=A0AA38VWR1_9PEZI|nr:Feruloyl esterase [Pleurostoma richardsiae]
MSPTAAAPVSSLVTVIITTSPTPSAPSTDLLSTALASFRLHCPELAESRVVVTFDAYDQIVSKARLKKGYATAEVARDYVEYKENAKKLIIEEFLDGDVDDPWTKSTAEAEYGSPCIETNVVSYSISQSSSRRVTFIEPFARLGFGLSVRSALRLVETPYVWVHQHDWKLTSDIPLGPIVEVMGASEANEEAPIKYVCFPSIRRLTYADSPFVTDYPALKAVTSALKQDFAVPSDPGSVTIPLTPLFFWHDKPHVASTVHYLARVFPSRLAMGRGDFIEDTVGHRARTQMKGGQWRKWATWLYYPDSGRQQCVRHLLGRTWRGAEQELKQGEYWRAFNAKNALAAAEAATSAEVSSASNGEDDKADVDHGDEGSHFFG